MDGIFTLPYSEVYVAETLNHLFRPKEGYGVFIPSSRQQKGIDLLLYNQKNVASKGHWEKHTLCFTKKEMSAFLGRIKLRNSDRADSHFTLELRHDGTIWEGRGRPKEERKEIKGRLLKDRIDKMKRELG